MSNPQKFPTDVEGADFLRSICAPPANAPLDWGLTIDECIAEADLHFGPTYVSTPSYLKSRAFSGWVACENTRNTRSKRKGRDVLIFRRVGQECRWVLTTDPFEAAKFIVIYRLQEVTTKMNVAAHMLARAENAA